jgi:hypothetical protein
MDRVAEELDEERLRQWVGVQDVVPTVEDEGRDGGQGVDEAADAGTNLLRTRWAPRWMREVRDADQIEQVGVLRLVELKRAADGISTSFETPRASPRSSRV